MFSSTAFGHVKKSAVCGQVGRGAAWRAQACSCFSGPFHGSGFWRSSCPYLALLVLVRGWAYLLFICAQDLGVCVLCGGGVPSGGM